MQVEPIEHMVSGSTRNRLKMRSSSAKAREPPEMFSVSTETTAWRVIQASIESESVPPVSLMISMEKEPARPDIARR
jgi:hypothetical protein